MNKSIYMCFLALGLAITPAYATEKDPAEKVSLGALATGPDKHTAAIQADIVDLMLAKKDSVIGGTGEATYKDNLNSTRENQNKIKASAVARSIALGKRAVALGTAASEDSKNLQEELRKQNNIVDFLRMMAVLSAQTMQKTNEITALRAKMVELNAIDTIQSGDVMTVQKPVDVNSIKAQASTTEAEGDRFWNVYGGDGYAY